MTELLLQSGEVLKILMEKPPPRWLSCTQLLCVVSHLLSSEVQMVVLSGRYDVVLPVPYR
jgi:hypothetical protein